MQFAVILVLLKGNDCEKFGKTRTEKENSKIGIVSSHCFSSFACGGDLSWRCKGSSMAQHHGLRHCAFHFVFLVFVCLRKT